MIDQFGTAMSSFLGFLAELRKRGIDFRLSTVRPEAVMVDFAVPGFRWEVEFLADETVEVERFDSQGVNTVASTVPDVVSWLDRS